MIITLLSLRQKKTDPFEAIALDYIKKIHRWRLVCKEILHKGNVDKVTTSDFINRQIPQGSVRLVLDERGEDITSPGFAKLLDDYAAACERNMTIMIGGPLGFDEAMRQSADHLVRFGRCTWPHKMVYVMVLEQLYRAQQILTNHPYHKV